MIYADAFQEPATWTLLGDLCEHVPRGVVIGGSCVRFYSTDPDATARLRAEFQRFAVSVPPGDTVQNP